MPRSFALGAHFEALIDALVQGGRYNNASEVVRAGLRLLEDREAERQRFVAEIRASIEENERAGVYLEADKVFDRLEEELQGRVRATRNEDTRG